MSLRSSIYAQLAVIPEFLGSFPWGIFPDAIPQAAQYPCVLFQFQNIDALYTLDGPTTVGDGGVVFSIFSYNKDDCAFGIDGVKSAFNGFHGALGDIVIRNAMKIVDEGDDEHPAPDGSSKILFEMRQHYSLDYQDDQAIWAPPTPPNPISGGSCTYTNLNPTPISVGGVLVGTTFDNATCTEVFNELFYPYQYPEFSSFAIANYSVLECGQSTANPLQFHWSCDNVENIEPGSLEITQNYGELILGGLNYNSSPQVVSDVDVLNSPGGLSWFIEGTDSQGGTFLDSVELEWRWRSFWGSTPVLTPTDPTVLRGLANNGLEAGIAGTYTFPASPVSYPTFVWPVSLGAPNTVKDQATGFGIAMAAPYQINLTNQYGEATEYNVYQMFNPTSGSLTIVIT